jgi:hypothetical protein
MEFSMNNTSICFDKNEALTKTHGQSMSFFKKIKNHAMTKVAAQTALAVGFSFLMVSHGFCAVEDIPEITLPDGTAADAKNPAAIIKAWVIFLVTLGASLLVARALFAFGSVSVDKFKAWSSGRGDLGDLGAGIGIGFLVIVTAAAVGFMLYGLFPVAT